MNTSIGFGHLVRQVKIKYNNTYVFLFCCFVFKLMYKRLDLSNLIQHKKNLTKIIGLCIFTIITTKLDSLVVLIVSDNDWFRIPFPCPCYCFRIGFKVYILSNTIQ